MEICMTFFEIEDRFEDSKNCRTEAARQRFFTLGKELLKHNLLRRFYFRHPCNPGDIDLQIYIKEIDVTCTITTTQTVYVIAMSGSCGFSKTKIEEVDSIIEFFLNHLQLKRI